MAVPQGPYVRGKVNYFKTKSDVKVNTRLE